MTPATAGTATRRRRGIESQVARASEVRGEEIGQELGLDEPQTAELVARLVRTGFLRDVAAHLRIKVTIRSIALVEREE